MLNINGTLILMVFSFLLFMFFMQKFFYGPLLNVRTQRKEYIENNLLKSKESNETAEQLLDNYKKEISDTRKEANADLLEKTKQASEEKQKIVDNIAKKLSVEIEEAKSQTQKQTDEVRAMIKPAVLNLAQDISAKILGEVIPLSVSPEIVDNALNG
jgi:F-type H+-transporting ATPase subunit b